MKKALVLAVGLSFLASVSSAQQQAIVGTQTVGLTIAGGTSALAAGSAAALLLLLASGSAKTTTN